MFSKSLKAVLIILLFLMISSGCEKKESEKIYIYAAASAKDVLNELISVYRAGTGSGTEFSCVLESSGKIAKQIQEGADADIFISASQKWMDELKKNSMIEDGTEFVFAKNSLVIIASEKVRAEVSSPADILKTKGKTALGDPKPVPAGKYAETALAKAGIYETMKRTKKAAFYENVRKVLNAVEMNQADFGIVYRSDAAASDRVKTVYTFAEEDHGPIVYPAAAVKGHCTKETKDFLDFLKSEKAQEIIRDRYFFK